MNLILVVLALSGRMYTPQYVIRYPTQQQCEQAAKPYNIESNNFFKYAQTLAVCVPEVK